MDAASVSPEGDALRLNSNVSIGGDALTQPQNTLFVNSIALAGTDATSIASDGGATVKSGSTSMEGGEFRTNVVRSYDSTQALTDEDLTVSGA